MPEKPRVFISRNIPEKPFKMIEEHCEIHIWEEETPPPRAKLLDELALADGAVVMLTEKMDKEAEKAEKSRSKIDSAAEKSSLFQILFLL